MKVHLMKTTMGWSAACFSTEGLLLLTLPCESLEAAMAEAWENFNQLMVCGEVFSSRLQAKDRASQAYRLYCSLVDYFEHGKDDFDVPIDWSITSDFARNVYQVVASIPYGEVRTYSWVAEQLGKPKAARAVGQALKRNPYPLVIPCHRVIAANGLGGFGGGLKMKKKLLSHERYKFTGIETG